MCDGFGVGGHVCAFKDESGHLRMAQTERSGRLHHLGLRSSSVQFGSVLEDRAGKGTAIKPLHWHISWYVRGV